MIIAAWIALVLAAIPLALIAVNLPLFRTPHRPERAPEGLVSILIPARDEERNIARALDHALAQEGVELEVVVLDDGSTDRTAEIVEAYAAEDPRVRLVTGIELPEGWIGKQHACARLAEHARGDWLLFQDADVTLTPDAALRLVGYCEARKVDLLSGVPRQITGTIGEKLIVPVIHFVLLGYLPMPGMRLTGSPAFAAAVGQLMLMRAEAYRATGGHSATRARIHDGMALAQMFRAKGQRTDLVDITPLVGCRMYDNFGDTWRGFAKNVHEGMGSPVAIWIWTTLLLGGHVLPWLGLLVAEGEAFSLLVAAVVVSMLARFVLTIRFRQDWLGALLHPLGVAMTVAIQWYGLTRWLAKRPVAWKGRMPT